MTISPLAGEPAPREILVDLVRLERECYECRPDPEDPGQLVSFGTSGHRGLPLRGSTEAHILAITQAICDHRKVQMVCGGPIRQFVMLWRRRERRGQFPAARRQSMDDRQGRIDHESAGR